MRTIHYATLLLILLGGCGTPKNEGGATKKSPPDSPKKAAETVPASTPTVTPPASKPTAPPAAALGPKCEKVKTELLAQCSKEGLSEKQKAFCASEREAVVMFLTMINPTPAQSQLGEEGCNDTLELWSIKGGLAATLEEKK